LGFESFEPQKIHFRETEDTKQERRPRMADRTKTKPGTEPPTKEAAPGISWSGIATGIVMIALLVFVVYGIFQIVGAYNARPSQDEVLGITVTTPPVTEVVPTTEPVVQTTKPVPTTEPAPTTTVPEATEPTLPGFYWGTEPAPLGFLREDSTPDQYGGLVAFLSGTFLEVEQRDLDFPWEAESVTLWVARFDLGEHPVTGDPVVGEFVLATEVYGETILFYCQMGGRWLPGDPGRPPNTTNGTTTCGDTAVENAASTLRVGRQYPLEVTLDQDCSALPVNLGKLQPQAGCEQFMLEEGAILLSYNRAMVAALKSGEIIPEGMGLLNQLYIPLPSPVPPL
jgi:hypothetical protein